MIRKPSIECVNIGIDISSVEPPQKKIKRKIPNKLLLILRKYKFNWRINQLAKPKQRCKKFVPISAETYKYKEPKTIKLAPNTRFYTDQMARPPLRILLINRRLYGEQNGRKYKKNINRNIAKSWASIYNFYKKNDFDKKRRKQLRNAKIKEKQKKKINEEKFGKLAQPKKVHLPPKKTKPEKIFENYIHLDTLATPSTREVPKPKELKVNPAALTYEATENILKLASPPRRYHNILPPVEPGKVKRSALKYKITPRIESMAVPKQHKEKAKEDEDFDPWAISKNALKYKATPRILELAKPQERD